ncbi:hypothetical protein [Methylocella silvestris]|uniref:Uncharacterized protein n=1 Tax=Methylocella silvestris TaxID=199596 RepID=A0A2J7TG13_METSI|nr:hypothetical protein [Methylocella silvestris]PNG25721.1 hypothetical protein CR492_12450 [Methylocella silvestris]
MAQNLIPFIARKPNLVTDPDLQNYLDRHLIPGWRQFLISVAIKADTGDAEAAKLSAAMRAWVATLCRRRNIKNRKAKIAAAGVNVISMAKFRAAGAPVAKSSQAV